MAAMVKVVQVNDATLKLFGAETEQAFIESIDKVFGPGAIDVFIKVLCAIWEKKEKTFRSEVAHKTLSGEELTVIVSLPIPETEEDFRSVPVSIIDITERKRLEEAVRRSEARFRSAFESAAHGISIVALDNRYLEVNEAFCEIVGYSEAELLATDFQTITRPDDLDAAGLEKVRRLFAGESPSFQREKHFIRKDGSEVLVLLATGLVRNAGGDPLYCPRLGFKPSSFRRNCFSTKANRGMLNSLE